MILRILFRYKFVVIISGTAKQQPHRVNALSWTANDVTASTCQQIMLVNQHKLFMLVNQHKLFMLVNQHKLFVLINHHKLSYAPFNHLVWSKPNFTPSAISFIAVHISSLAVYAKQTLKYTLWTNTKLTLYEQVHFLHNK